MKKISFFVLLAFCNLICFSQNLYMPRDVSHAFANGTRAMNGMPGKNYWQNRAHYSIKVNVMPPDRNIKGTEDIEYINNSPDTLRELEIRLIQNAHLPMAMRNFDVDSGYITSGITIDAISSKGQNIKWKDPDDHFTFQYVNLPQALLPHDSVSLHIEWHYFLSASIETQPRDGVVDSTTFFLAYFYPRIAVYDDYEGWDILDFTELQEFYNDFCDYDVTIHTPNNFAVWATGSLQNQNEMLQPSIISRLNESMKTDSVVHIVSVDDLKNGNFTTNKTNEWKWKATDVTDFAFGVSDHYLWDATSVNVDAVTGRRVSAQAAYDNSSVDFRRAAKVARFTIDFLSHQLPDVPFPYPKETIFNGLSGMEYPMMVNDFSDSDLIDMKTLTNHEVAHTYFPFYMGTNESRYAFMDEGWAAFFELESSRLEMPVDTANKKWTDFYTRFFPIKNPDLDLPIITPSNQMKDPGYEANAYGKPALGYEAVEDLLGNDLFRKCLQQYIARWHGKHPLPWDFFNTFNDVSGQNLNWFWQNWFFENHYLNLMIMKAEKTASGYNITINNVGGFAQPFDLKIIYADGSSSAQHQTPAVWKNNSQQALIPVKTSKTIKSASIESDIFLNTNPKDNSWNAQ